MNFLARDVTGVLSLVLAAGATAQVSTTVIQNGGIPRSIVLAPVPGSMHAIVSMSAQSEQIPLDVTVPSAPLVGFPTFHSQDQYCDATWTPAFGGRLLTAHRGGGIQIWDASPGTIAGAFPLLGYTPTNYSHEGLDTITDPLGNTFVFYSEQHTSPTSFGGLKTYQLVGNTLTPVGQTLFLAGAGRDMAVDRYGRIVWQWGDQSANQLNGMLRVYYSNLYGGNPILANAVPYAFTYGYPDTDLEINATGNNLVSCMGWDGLVAVDVTSPVNPVITTMFGAQQVIFFDGVTFIPGTDFALMWGFVRIGSTEIDFLWWLNCSVPGLATPIGGPSFPGFRVDDVKILAPHIYCVGRTRTTTPQSQVVVY